MSSKGYAGGHKEHKGLILHGKVGKMKPSASLKAHRYEGWRQSGCKISRRTHSCLEQTSGQIKPRLFNGFRGAKRWSEKRWCSQRKLGTTPECQQTTTIQVICSTHSAAESLPLQHHGQQSVAASACWVLCTHNLSLLRAERNVSNSYSCSTNKIMTKSCFLVRYNAHPFLPQYSPLSRSLLLWLWPHLLAYALPFWTYMLILWTAVDSVQSKYVAWISISCSSAWPGPHESSAPSGLSGLSCCFLKLLTNWKESFQTTVTKCWNQNHLLFLQNIKVSNHQQPATTPQCNISHSALNWCSPPDPASSWCYRTWSNQIVLCYLVTCNMIWKTCEKFPHSYSNLQSFL